MKTTKELIDELCSDEMMELLDECDKWVRLFENVIFDTLRAIERHKATPEKIRSIFERYLYEIESRINIDIIWGFHWLFAELEGDKEKYYMGFDGELGCYRLFEERGRIWRYDGIDNEMMKEKGEKIK